MRIFSRQRATTQSGQQPTVKPCTHDRVSPHTTSRDMVKEEGLTHKLHTFAHAACMDCGKPVSFDMGQVAPGPEPEIIRIVAIYLRANGYMQNELNPELWERLV